MRAAQVRELTGPDGVEVAEVDEPTAGENVLVEVKAAGISFPDLLMSKGEYQIKSPAPFTLGVEGAGVVRSAPAGSGFAPGDEVIAFGGGAVAELMVASPAWTFPLPGAFSFAQGAALVMNYHTAHFALVRRAHVAAGETVLVQGAAGGVGTACIQVAKALAARTIAVVSSAEKEDVARQAGADDVVRSDGDWKAAVKELTGGRGADVVFDPVGGDRLHESIRALATEGRLIVIGFTEGAIPQVAVNRLLFRNVSVVGAAWGEFALPRPDYVRDVAASLDEMVVAGHVRPVIGHTYRLDEVPVALRDLAERRATGKLVVEISS